MNNENTKAFQITSICKEDMQSIGFDTSTLTDQDMERIAQIMTEDYLATSFWSSMESILIDIYKLKQHDM